MSVTYVAWNGEPYPWPPPDGWYQAVDGRWWAPGTGPEPHRGTASDAGGTETGGTVHVDTGGRQSDAERSSEDQGKDQQTILTTAHRNTLPGYDEVTRSHAEAEAENHRTAAGHPGGIEPSGRDRTKGGSGMAVLWLAGLGVLVMLGAGLGFLTVRNVGTNDNTPSSTTLVSGEAAPPTTLQLDGPTQAEPPPSTTTAQGATQSTTPPPTGQSTINGQTSATTTTTTVAPDDDALVAAWRAELAERNIDSTALSDLDIIDFGKSFCVFAVVSIDSDEFDEFRDKAQTGVAGSLTEPQLNAAIDAAVITFCPEDAARLGIAPG